MRNLRELDPWRVRHPMWGSGDSTCGAFIFGELRVIASSSEDWDHVSVSRGDRCPTWEEMEKMKHRFFKDDEVAMQLHVPPKDHINIHPFCLHMWRPHKLAIPTPPSWMVG
jgi:hypothetical protein